jgi:[protein-PII] uridylyltransferase
VALEPGKWSRLQLTLERVLRGEADVFELVRRTEPVLIFPRRALRVPTRVEIDNEASEDFSIVEVYTRDRTGVLFRIAYCLHKLDLSIHLAKISTNVDQVADVFYVVEKDGRKVADEARLERVRDTLYRELSESNDGDVRDAS